MTGDSLIFGTEGTEYGFGAFEGSNVFTVNVNPWFTGDFEALEIGYVVYDDGWDNLYDYGPTVNAVGSDTINELGYEFKTETHWNLRNSSNTVLLYDQTFVSGQNCVNLDGTMTGDSLIFGTEGTEYGFGAFEGSNVFTVNVNPWFTGDFEALEIGYVVYDDGWDNLYDYGPTVNAVGSDTINELGYEFKTETHWNLRNSSNTVLLYYQTFVSGLDIYGGMSVGNMSKLHHTSAAAVTLNGLQVNVTGGYAAPNDWYGWTFEAGRLDISVVGEAYFDLGSYAQHGWALTARAVDTWGSGITSTDILQRDIQIRFTGEIVDEPTVTASGVVYYPALDEGGSYAFITGSRLDDLANHPDPGTTAYPNDGTGAPFRIKIRSRSDNHKYSPLHSHQAHCREDG
jgi:hypothetical protein